MHAANRPSLWSFDAVVITLLHSPNRHRPRWCDAHGGPWQRDGRSWR